MRLPILSQAYPVEYVEQSVFSVVFTEIVRISVYILLSSGQVQCHRIKVSAYAICVRCAFDCKAP